ncbi:coiled-coil domain-containing protein 81-like isoform X1 [Gallus gallus]|uniref:coiled-coil domain-containing protein 81-like isoform X1 n=1 Tax=Gallus gallus TaxID=9031 RepID=UPI001AE14108|nr:coiled-coil domain-containing protein 81-like isoform X1 [Gallus gallus]
MSSGMAGANKEQPAGTRRNRMSFCEDGPAARRASRPTCTDTEGTRLHSHHRSAAAANPGTQTTLSICHLTPAWQREGCREAAGAECDLLFLCPPERVAVWDAVAAYVQEHLLVQKGVWIPTFGSFDTISRDIRTEDGTVTLRWPVFHLSGNLIAVHHLKPRRESLPAHRKLEPLKSSEVAAAASVTWQTAQACIQSTVSLLSGCLKNGENVAVVFKDIGVLHIDGMTFHMKFYYDFLDKLSGKEKFRKALLKAPWLLDMVVSRAAPVASLALSGCLVVFPKFQMEFVPKPPPGISRRSSGGIPAEGKPKEEEALPPLAQGKKVRFAGKPTFIKRLSSDSLDGGKLRRIRSLLRKESSTSSLLPAIPGVPEDQKQPLTCQLQGQAETDSQEDLGRAPGTKHVSFREEEREAEKAHRVAAVLKLPKANESFSNDSRPSSRAQSSPSQASQGTPSRLPLLACDSVRLLRRRAKKSRQKEPEEMEASTSQAEASQPQESSADRAGFLPPINEETQSPQRQPPNSKAPPRRKGTHYPR